MNRRYILANYTAKQKKTIQKILHTNSYVFNEPFEGLTEGLYVSELNDYHTIARLINIDYQQMLYPIDFF